MSAPELSDAFYFVLLDEDVVWPSTVDGRFRLSHGGEGHNILGEGEYAVSERDMIHGVLNEGKASRFRSKTNRARERNATLFSTSSPSVSAVFVNVKDVYVRLK
ncbi:MAG TPA: hypothetical protein VEL76_37290 [Gemmataceae bacterium]|nr:hypothetical protein [Gemmataceae bacterium]